MRPWQLIVAALLCLAAAACRTDPNIAILERELRMQEDQMYQLKDCLEDSQAALEACRRESAALRNRLRGGDAADTLPHVSAPATAVEPGVATPSRTSAEPGPVGPPSINLGTPTPSGDVPETLKGRPNRPSSDKPPAPEPPSRSGADRSAESIPGPELPGITDTRDAVGGAAAAGNPPVARGDSRRVGKIVLNRMLTGGYNGGGRAGDAGVMVVIEPRDAQGKYVAAPADVSIVVVDPALEGEAARVARWDLAAGEIARLFRQTALAQGIELEMPWPAGPPAHADLHLFVRYTTSDGRKLEANQPIKIDLPHELSTRWVPTDQTTPGGATTPTTQNIRSEGPWRPAPSTSRLATASPRTAALPSSRAGGSFSQSTAPRLQRPVWSPERE